MKKTLVALAALAVVGAASAQSTVTLYGKIDVTVQNRTQKTSGVKTADGNVGLQINSAGLSGNRFGLKGSEDLGGGLRAIFDLQNGFSVDTGTLGQAGRIFGRQAYGGFAGGFGTTTFGRQYSPWDNSFGTYDAQGYTTNSAMNYAWNGGPALALGNQSATSPANFNVHNDVGRINSSVVYTTPNFSGFTLQGMFSPGEDKNPVTGQSASKMYGLWANYAAGPLGVSVAYDRNGLTGAGGVSSNNSAWMLVGSYDFGVVKLYGGFERARSSLGGAALPSNTTNGNVAAFTGLPSGRDKGVAIGVTVPFGAMTLALGAASEKTRIDGAAADGKNSAVGGQLVYSLSKRTNLYADFLAGKSRTDASITTRNTFFGVGMRHDF
jgi:predicted porin